MERHLLSTRVFIPFGFCSFFEKRNRKNFFLFPLFEKSGAKTFQSACAYAQAKVFIRIGQASSHFVRAIRA
ncbi:MAG: hypothetical protein ACI4JC_06675, partial [Faecalibacterium sp.]